MKWLTVIAAPALLWIGYLYYKDRYHPEPISRVLLSFALGVGSAVVALHLLPDSAMDIIERGRLSRLWFSLGVIGPVEEVAKAVPFALVCMRLEAFDEKIDGIIYASAVGIGFASYENVLYMGFLDGVALYGRAIASPLVHSIFASIFGYAAAYAAMTGRSVPLYLGGGLVVAAALHGLYDFLALDPVWFGVSTVTIGIVWLWRVRLVKRLQDEERARQRAAGDSGRFEG